MFRLTLERHESGPQGTFGRLCLPNKTFLYTGELPWVDNEANISCIPKGDYLGSWTLSVRFKRKLYLLTPTDPRTGIRIHSANLMGSIQAGYHSQLNGCIALGEKLGWIDGQKAILLSVSAIRKFESSLGGKPFILEVI